MNRAEVLFQLQAVEQNMIRCQKRLNEIAAVLADDEAVARAQATVNSAQKMWSGTQTQVRDLEFEIQTTAQKAETTETELYSGRVTNPKEMQEMQQEVAALKRRHAELEERLLGLMEASEQQEAALNEATAALRETTNERQADKLHLLDEQATLQDEMSALRKQREGVVRQVPPDDLRVYTGLRSKKANQPVALLNGESCGVCGVEQTMAIVRQAQMGQSLVMCLSCGRILYYKG